MKEAGVAKRYAVAIYEMAKKENKEMEIYETLESLLNIYEKDIDFKNMMLHPLIEISSKVSMIKKMLSNADATSIDIVSYLVEKNRIEIIRFITSEYLKLYYKENNEVAVTAIFPIELNEDQKHKLLKKLEHKMGKKIILNVQIDKDIIGGGVIKVGDEIIDGSIKRQVDMVRNIF